MTYEPKRPPGGIYDVREYFAKVKADSFRTPAAKRLDEVWASLPKVYGEPPEAPRVATPPAQDGPMMQKAEKMAAAIARAKAAGAIEANNGIHKLAPYVFGGG